MNCYYFLVLSLFLHYFLIILVYIGNIVSLITNCFYYLIYSFIIQLILFLGKPKNNTFFEF